MRLLGGHLRRREASARRVSVCPRLNRDDLVVAGVVDDVVVKVQYPDVERYFRMDVLALQSLYVGMIRTGVDLGIKEEDLRKIFSKLTESFVEELLNHRFSVRPTVGVCD